MAYCLYLRKSRADLDAEARGERETLARHERTLLNLAKRLSLNVTEIYREVVSGETIAARPAMQRLLSEVEQGAWEGVLVMEVERLARGDTIDQGLVAQAFKYSDTKIITPAKTYDPNDEFDEEYFEFGLFMSRREYKTIRRRLTRGYEAAQNEGKWVHSEPPYGYNRVKVKNGKGYTLEINPDEARVVRLIFDLYTSEYKNEHGEYRQIGVRRISSLLNEFGIKKRHPKQGRGWDQNTIYQIIHNPVYCGYIRANKTKTVKTVVDNQVVKKRIKLKPSEWKLSKGLHEPIISEEQFRKTMQKALDPANPVPGTRPLKNPFASLIKCKYCGMAMFLANRHVYGYSSYLCPNSLCKCVGNYADEVNDAILAILRSWADGYFDDYAIDEQTQKQIDQKQLALESIQAELDNLSSQLSRTYDLLEQGVYDADTFLTRSRLLSDSITELSIREADLLDDLESLKGNSETYADIAAKAQYALDVWYSDVSPKEKNDAMKLVIEKILYSKDEPDSAGDLHTNFSIELFPKLSKNR